MAKVTKVEYFCDICGKKVEEHEFANQSNSANIVFTVQMDIVNGPSIVLMDLCEHCNKTIGSVIKEMIGRGQARDSYKNVVDIL
jgi:hypothetical protein